ncbi:hypothetical protein [Croceicoccus bisphenolivorans]|uniref:hypothetical protein n=1 Tax=Croceicoccus bisphenolivorans TaxID=1783232 RepID=UPI0009EE399E|nr:hypothetical protein [Croceicoccus bisphenolivorans]
MPPSNSKPARTTHSRQPARTRSKVVLGGGALVAVIAFWGWQPLTSQAEAGTAFGARMACSCRFIGGRELGDCEKDFVDGMAMVSLSEDTTAKSVTASVPLVSSTTATYREGWGCVLEPYED